MALNAAINAYNSDHFGWPMYDVTDLEGGESPSEVEALIRDLRAGHARHVSVKVPTGCKQALNALLSNGFMLVDTQMEYVATPTNKNLWNPPEGYSIRWVAEADGEAIASIARDSFETDRWHSDPSLPNVLCDEYYAHWIESCIAGYAQAILVAEHEGKPVGFMTLRICDSSGRIDLTAVERSHRMRGVYKSLVSSALRWAFDSGLGSMLATTQINNMGSQHTWINAGFNLRSSNYVLHKRLDDKQVDQF